MALLSLGIILGLDALPTHIKKAALDGTSKTIQRIAGEFKRRYFTAEFNDGRCVESNISQLFGLFHILAVGWLRCMCDPVGMAKVVWWCVRFIMARHKVNRVMWRPGGNMTDPGD